MTDAEKFVRERCPDASLIGPMKNGRYHPDGGYGILLHSVQSFTSGNGWTAEEAWADAAKRLAEKEALK